jgi:hypothetical protein
MSRDIDEWMLETYARNAAHNPGAITTVEADAQTTVSFSGKSHSPWSGPTWVWNLAVERAKTEWRQLSTNLNRVIVGAVDGTP